MNPLKLCTCCKKWISANEWNLLPPPANGRLLAMGLEWRNHDCGGTLCIAVEELLEDKSGDIEPTVRIGNRSLFLSDARFIESLLSGSDDELPALEVA